MKKKLVWFGFTTMFLFSVLFVFGNNPDDKKKLNMPENVKTLIENSCYGCHHTASKNDKAKEEFDFDKINELSKLKKIGAYKHISDVIEKSEMPPKKFLERYPDRSLSADEKKIIMDWANKEAMSLVKNQ